MKHTIAIILLALLLAFLLILCSCGKNDTGVTAPATSASPATSDTENKPEVSLAPETTTPTAQPDNGLDYLTDVVVFQNDHITVTITGAKRDSSGYLTLDIKVENKSSQNLDFNFLDAYINGVHVPTVNNISVGANETVTKDVYFVDTYILGNFIDRYTDIELMFWLGDSDNRLKYQQEGFFHYYPYGKEEATVYKPEDSPSNVTVVETNDFALTALGFREEEGALSQYVVDLYIENKSENNLLFDVLDVKVNGKDCDPLYTDNVAGGHASLSRMDWTMQKLADAGVEMPVESIELKLRAKNMDDFYADPVYEEIVTITPPQ